MGIFRSGNAAVAVGDLRRLPGSRRAGGDSTAVQTEKT